MRNVYERNCWAFQMGVRPFCQRVFVSENHLKPLELCRLVYTRISSICIFEKWTFLDLRYSIPNMKKNDNCASLYVLLVTVYPRLYFFSLPKLISPYHCARKNNVLHTYFVLHVYELFKFEYTNINNWNPSRKQFLGFWSFL